MFTYQKELLPTGEIFSAAWKFYKTIILSVLFWSFLIACAYVVHGLLGHADLSSLGSRNVHLSLYDIIGYLLVLLIWSFLHALIIHRMDSIAENHKTSLWDSIKVACKKLIPLYIATLIFYLLTMAGIFLFAFPGIFIWTLLIMYSPLIVLDNNSIIQSFLASARLVWGSWWETFFVVMIPTLIVSILRYITRFIEIDRILLAALDIVLLTLVTPYLYSILLIQLRNLKLKMRIPSFPKYRHETPTKIS